MSDDSEHRCAHIVGGASHPRRRQCQNTAIHGDYCGVHFQHPERRIEAAKVSLHDYVEDAIRALGEIVVDGEKHADRIKAATSILDRTGNGPGQTLTLESANRDLDQRLKNVLNTPDTDDQ